MFVLRALTETESKYAQIEKECLSIVHACTRFNQYVCGKDNVINETDHQQLINIFNRPLVNAPRCIQRMILRLQRYNLIVTYKKGKEMLLADALSRIFNPDQNIKTEEVQDNEVFSINKVNNIFEEIAEINVLENIDINDDIIQKIQAETVKDTTLIHVKNICINGRPNGIHDLSEEVKPFWKHRSEIVTTNKILFKCYRIIIPKTLRETIMDKIHYGHLGIDSCLKRPRDSVYWPQINDHIKNKIKSCEICATGTIIFNLINKFLMYIQLNLFQSVLLII